MSQQPFSLLVAADLRRGEDEILLVEQQCENAPSPTWGQPEGVVEPGELLL